MKTSDVCNLSGLGFGLHLNIVSCGSSEKVHTSEHLRDDNNDIMITATKEDIRDKEKRQRGMTCCVYFRDLLSYLFLVITSQK